MEKACGHSMVGYSPENARADREWLEFLLKLEGQPIFYQRPTLRDWLPEHYKEKKIEEIKDEIL